jgi:hypothetical protein
LPWRSRCVAGRTVARLAAGQGRAAAKHPRWAPSPAGTRRSLSDRRFRRLGKAYAAAMLAGRQRPALRADIAEVRDPAGVTQTIVRVTVSHLPCPHDLGGRETL